MNVHGLVYTVGFDNVSVAALQDLLTIAPASAGLLAIIMSAKIGQSDPTSDAGDAAEEFLRVSWSRSTTAGTGGTTQVPVAHSPGVAASGILCRKNDTAPASASLALIDADTFNVRAGYQYRPIPEEMLMIGGGVTNDVLVLTLEENPADAIELSASITFMEVRF